MLFGNVNDGRVHGKAVTWASEADQSIILEIELRACTVDPENYARMMMVRSRIEALIEEENRR